jgi:ethanolamine ammonia-lyase large subunit
MSYATVIDGTRYVFPSLRELLAKASPLRSGDVLAGLAAETEVERAAAQIALADVPLTNFLLHPVVPGEGDEVTRLILESHDPVAFACGEPDRGHVSQMAAFAGRRQRRARCAGTRHHARDGGAVSKIMRLQDLVAVAAKCRVVTRFRNTLGLPGRLSTRLQPNHPTDDSKGIAASVLDGLLLASGDAVIGVNPVTDNLGEYIRMTRLLDDIRMRLDIPTQTCVLGHVTTAIEAIERGAPVDLVFQSVAGTEKANAGFGVTLSLLQEARAAALSLRRGTVGDNVMYLETGQGSALSADAHYGVDQQTLEARAYAVARALQPLLVNTVVGFIGPEYLFDGKQITRAGLEDHFCGKLLGLPMGVDVCYTNHAEADQDDMDALLTLLAVAGVTFVIAVPGADDIMLNYQSTSHHDADYVRQVLGRRPAPEFEAWLQRTGIVDRDGALADAFLPEAMRPALSVVAAV